MNTQHYCIYCNKPARYQFKNGNWCCQKFASRCPVIKEKYKEKALNKWKQVKEAGYNQLNNPLVIKQEITENKCAYCGQYAQYKLKNGKWCCKPYSTQCPSNRKKNSQMIKSMYSQDGMIFNGKARKDQYTQQSRRKQGWNRGLTKYTDQRIKQQGQKLSQKYKKGQLKPSQLGKRHTKQQKDKIVYGMIHFSPGKNKKGFKKGWYKGYWCDSSWQLAFVMYNLDNNIKFSRNIKGFDYQYNGKIRRFYPDFILNNEYIQIKGYYCDMVQAKINSFPKDLVLKILVKKDMKIYLDYARNKYGIDYWKLLKDKND